MREQEDPFLSETGSNQMNGIEDVFAALKSETVRWGTLMTFAEKSFHDLNAEFDRIRESCMEMEIAGQEEVSQQQMGMANFFIAARDNAMILHVVARLGAEIEKLHQQLDKVEALLKETDRYRNGRFRYQLSRIESDSSPTFGQLQTLRFSY